MDIRGEGGVTLVEVLVSTAVASVTLAAAGGLLAGSARAVADSELETTAIWAASRTIEEWRSMAVPVSDGHQRLDRAGAPVAGAGLFDVAWTAQPEAAAPGQWRVTATVTSPRLREPVVAEAVVPRHAP